MKILSYDYPTKVEFTVDPRGELVIYIEDRKATAIYATIPHQYITDLKAALQLVDERVYKPKSTNPNAYPDDGTMR